ncbi:NERD domain-containing protein [bacterium]|nr:NERD domain-containing protein [bacterium]
MARIVSRAFCLDEFIVLPPVPPPPTVPKAPPRGLQRVPWLVWVGLVSCLLPLSLPVGAFAVAALSVWALLSGMAVPATPRPPRRRWRADVAYADSLDETGRIGLQGERDVLSCLTRLPDSVLLLHDLTLPTDAGRTQLDIVVVAPDGVTCLEVKAWAGRVYGREGERSWTQVKLYAGRVVKDRRENPVQQNAYHCQALARYLTRCGVPAPVRSVVVFTRGELRTETTTPVMPAHELRSVLELGMAPAVLTPEQVNAIGACLHERLTQPGETLAVTVAPVPPRPALAQPAPVAGEPTEVAPRAEAEPDPPGLWLPFARRALVLLTVALVVCGVYLTLHLLSRHASPADPIAALARICSSGPMPLLVGLMVALRVLFADGGRRR